MPVQQAAFLLLRFVGCTPSANIGTLRVASSCTVKPIPSQQGLYNLSVRGGYTGT